jgi:4-amino-4-deoxy-L-arabinose transferase-like glycosyltransferase
MLRFQFGSAGGFQSDGHRRGGTAFWPVMPPAAGNPNAQDDGRLRATLGRVKRRAPVLLLLGAAALYLFRLGRVGLYDFDEGVYAEISREMHVTKNWLTPHLDFIPYLEKPPLFYWLNALAFKTLGLSEFSGRLSTALAAIAGVGFVYRIGRDIWSRRAGVAAGAILATSFGFFIFGRLMLPDMLFTGLLTAAFWGFSRALLDETATRAAVFAGYAAMGGAVLAKGLIGLVFPSLAVGAFLLLTRDWRLVRRLELARGGAVFLLITVPWHALMAGEYPGFLWFYVVNEHFMRFLGHRQLVNYATLPVATYLAMTLVWFCPWSFFLPAAVRRCWPRFVSGGRAERGSLFVLLWAGAVIVFFALSASRLEYYALPALPALALCVGRLWDIEAGKPRGQARSAGLTASWAVLIAFAVCLVPAAFLFPRLEHMRFYNLFPDVALPADSAAGGALATAKVYVVPGFGSLVPLFEKVVALIIAGTAASAWAWFRHRPILSLACLVGAMGVGLTAIEDGFVQFEPYRSIVRLAGVLRDELRPGDQILIEGKYEHHAGLSFYTGRQIRVYRGLDGILLYGSHFAGATGTFVSEEEFALLWRGRARVYLLSDAPDCLSRMRGLAPGTIVLGRTGNNWLLANCARAN